MSSAAGPAVGDVLIVGGGIGGLGAAIALGRQGVRATVLERDHEATGAAIAIQYRCLYAMQELGVIERMVREGSPLYASETLRATPVWDGSGTPQALAVAELSDDWELPFAISIYRPALARIMQEAVREHGGEVLLGESYTRVQQAEDGVEVELTTGESRRFDLLIAADGINSTLRERLFPELGGPVYTGSMSFRVMIPNGRDHWPTGLHAHRGAIIRTTLLPDHQFYIAAPNHMERRHIEQDEAREIVRELLDNFSGDPLMVEVRQALTDEIHVIVAPFEWIYVPAPWYRGRVVLVGDAAHATCPTIGSAGGMAVEDACVLAQELSATDDLKTALDAYSRRRSQRAQLVVQTSVALMEAQQQHRPASEWAEMRAVAFRKLLEAY